MPEYIVHVDLASENLKYHNKHVLAQNGAAVTATDKLSRSYWIIRKVYGDGHYDVQKESARVYEFNFQTGTLGLPTDTYEDQTLYEHVFCIIPRAIKYLDVGDVVKLGFYNNNKQKPFIKQVIKSFRGKEPIVANIQLIYGRWTQAWGNPGLNRSVLSAMWDPDATPVAVWTGTSNFAAVPLGVLVTDAGVITAQPLRNEANTAWASVKLDIVNEGSFTVGIGSSPSFFVGYGDMWSNQEGNFVLTRLGPHLQELYRLRENNFERLTLLSLGSRTLSDANFTFDGKFVLGRASRTPGSNIILNFGGTPWPNVPVETIPQGTLVSNIQCWDTNTSLTSLSESWNADPTTPSYFLLTNSWILTGASQTLSVSSTNFVGAYAFRKRPLPSEDGDYGLAVLWGWDVTLPGGNWSGNKDTENNTCSRILKAYLQAFLQASGASVWRREVQVDLTTLPVVTDTAILTPLTNWLESGVTAPDVFAGVIAEQTISNTANGEGELQPAFRPFLLPYRRFADRPQIVLFPANRNNIAPTDVDGNWHNIDVFHAWAPVASGTGDVVCDAAGNEYWAYAHQIEWLAAGGALHRDENLLGRFAFPYLGNQPVSRQNEDLSYTLYHNPDYYPMIGRFVEKVSPSGALIWKADLTQRVSGLSWYATESDLGVAGTEVIGGNTSTPHPLGDNIQWVRPCGRVVFVAADFHSLGPNFQPTTKLLILDDSNGTLLHTIPLYLNDSLVSADVYGNGSDTTTGDGSTTYFTFYPGQEIAEITELRIDGTPTTAFDLFIEIDNFSVNFYDPPIDGSSIEVDYRFSTLLYKQGEYFYDVQDTEFRGGQTEDGVEFAVIFITQVSRESPQLNYPRTMLVQLHENLATAPIVTTHLNTWGATSTLALADGNLLDIVYEGSWKIVAK